MRSAYTLIYIHMKQIIKLDRGKYVHLDSYGEIRKSHPLESFIVGFMVTAMAAIAVGALFGNDITKMPNLSAPIVKPAVKY